MKKLIELSQGERNEIALKEMAMHKNCCGDIGHLVTIIAHRFIEKEFGYENRDKIWNSQKPSYRLLVYAMNWRALWALLQLGLVELKEAKK